ncbi:MAG: HPr family phosphocarrier protein [Mogibacterium sp.]|nr:HPr family phosphocarrier protein [Oscillospiraceae bacterium]MBR2805649.1 HPr family phosphocarrier protein [Oscillospiraceae bacterium]MBR3124079.1 HPr family phosphocarrier protein [Mogibacterium sp.]
MKSFDYVITDEVGIHARPAGLLAREVKGMAGSTVSIGKTGDEKVVNVLKVMGVMGLGIKKGDSVTVTVEGGDEDAVCAKVEEFFKANF